MKFGIIGCKTIAASYKGALQSLPDATLAGVYDINQETARSFAEGTGAVVYESLSALLESDIDAVAEGRSPLLGVAEGRWPVDIILAIYESSKTGKRVYL